MTDHDQAGGDAPLTSEAPKEAVPSSVVETIRVTVDVDGKRFGHTHLFSPTSMTGRYRERGARILTAIEALVGRMADEGIVYKADQKNPKDDYWFDGQEPTAYEVIRNQYGEVLRLAKITEGVIRRTRPTESSSFRASSCAFVQIVDGKPVQAFTADEIVFGPPKERS